MLKTLRDGIEPEIAKNEDLSGFHQQRQRKINVWKE